MSDVGVGRKVGIPSPETFGDDTTWTPLPGEYNLECDACGATWVGYEDAECSWCFDARERQREGQRQALLFPEWLSSDAGDPRYDDLDEVDKRIWDHTRGVSRDAGSLRAWGDRLALAVESGLVTEAEARAAIERSQR